MIRKVRKDNLVIQDGRITARIRFQDLGEYDRFDDYWSVEIPEGVTAIGERVFSDVKCRFHVEIPQTVKVIEKKSFAWSGVNDLSISEGLEVIDDEAFAYTYELRSIELPKPLKYIGKEAFIESPLKSLILPENLKLIGERAFYNNNLLHVCVENGVQHIGDEAFRACVMLSTASIPGTVNRIPKGLFFGCGCLENVQLGEGIEEIGESAFQDCALENLQIPDSVRIIRKNAFANALIDEKLILPESLEILEDRAFAECFELKCVVFPKRLETLAREYQEKLKDDSFFNQGAFCNCFALQEIRIQDHDK